MHMWAVPWASKEGTAPHWLPRELLCTNMSGAWGGSYRAQGSWSTQGTWTGTTASAYTSFPQLMLCALAGFFLNRLHVQLSKLCFTHTSLCSAKQGRREEAWSRSLIQEYRNTSYIFMHTHRLVCWKFPVHQIKIDKATNSDTIYP